MLSDALREMRYEFLRRTADTKDCVQFSISEMLSILVALQLYEDEAQDMQIRMPPKPSRKPKTSGTIIPFPLKNRTRLMPVVIHGSGPGGNIA